MAKEVPFLLTDDDPNITADATFGTTWRDTWKFRCPAGMRILLRKGDTLSVYVLDSGDAEIAAPDALVKVEVRDPSEQNIVLAYGPDNYLSATEFQNAAKKRKFQLDEPIVVKPREWIVVATKDNLGLDSASILTSYFNLQTTKVID